MDWSAQDIALVISTSATALGVLTGVLFPLIRDKFMEQRSTRKLRYDRIKEAIIALLSNLDGLQRDMDDRDVKLVMMKSGEKGDYLLEAPYRARSEAFEVNLRLIKVLSNEVGVDSDKLSTLSAKLQIARLEFSYSQGHLERGSTAVEILKLRSQLVSEIEDEATQILLASQRALKV